MAKELKDLTKRSENYSQWYNDLVIKAKRDGTGISGTGSYSAFDNAPQNLQQKHIQNRQNVISLEKLVQKSR